MTICSINGEILNLFAKVTAKRKESCKNIQKKARFLATLLSLVFYLHLLVFYPSISIFVVFSTSFYTFRKCSSSFSLGISAVSW